MVNGSRLPRKYWQPVAQLGVGPISGLLSQCLSKWELNRNPVGIRCLWVFQPPGPRGKSYLP